MLATPSKAGQQPKDLRGWIYDTKIDGYRCMAMWDGITLRLVNRGGNDMAASFPELDFASDVLGPLPIVLDGEIVAQSGSFQDTATRAKRTKPADVLAAVKTIPILYMAFDVLFVGNSDVRHLPYLERRALLDSLDWPADSIWQKTVVSPDPAFYDKVKALGMEGVIAKQPRSKYRAGRFSDWVKFKATHRITAIGVGYEPGEGRRAHFGAMFLALLDDAGQPVRIGKVGTGFTDSEIDWLKGEFDNQRPVLVEIECLNVSKDGQLRHPVYIGPRSDLSVADARMTQLAAIPVT